MTGMGIALDETLDACLGGHLTPPSETASQPSNAYGMPGQLDADSSTRTSLSVRMLLDELWERLGASAWNGIRAFVVKPGVAGGFETTSDIAAWAHQHRIQVSFLMHKPWGQSSRPREHLHRV